MIKGDLHRFGRQVSFDYHSKVVSKPRSVFVEHLFLDKRSPISAFHKSLGINCSTHIESINSWFGECENLSPFIISDDEIKSNVELFAELAGKLIATSTVFGFNDLHFENILFVKKDDVYAIVPVDLEIIFYKFITSAECCLYPSIKVDLEKCGLKRLIPHLNQETVGILIENTIKAWDHAIEVAPMVQELLKDTPVRMLFRPTNVYAQYLNTSDENLFLNEPIPLAPEEKFQMSHGDIPYFFSYFNEPENVYYFDSPETTQKAEAMKAHPSFKRHLAAINVESDSMLFYTSLVHFLLNMLKERGWTTLNLSGESFNARIEEGYLNLLIHNKTIKVKL